MNPDNLDLTAYLLDNGLEPKAVSEVYYLVLERYVETMLEGTVYTPEDQQPKIDASELGSNIIKSIVDLKLNISNFPYKVHDTPPLNKITLNGKFKPAETLTQKEIKETYKPKKLGTPRPKQLPVDQYTRDGEFVARYQNLKEVAELTGINKNSVCLACRNVTKTAGHYQWRYGEKDQDPLPSIEPVEKYQSIAICQVVEQYDLNGRFIARFNSATNAEIETFINGSQITRCCKGLARTAGGFIWKFASEEYNTPINRRHKNHVLQPPVKAVDQYSIDGKFIKRFSSQGVASNETGAKNNAISMCCKGQRRTAGGFQWRYAEKGCEPIPYIGPTTPPRKPKKQDRVGGPVRSVEQYTFEGELVKCYESLKEASKETGINSGNICSACTGRKKSAGGFIWKHK